MVTRQGLITLLGTLNVIAFTPTTTLRYTGTTVLLMGKSTQIDAYEPHLQRHASNPPYRIVSSPLKEFC